MPDFTIPAIQPPMSSQSAAAPGAGASGPGPIAEAAEPGDRSSPGPQAQQVTARSRISMVREALRLGNTRAINVMPDPAVLAERRERRRQRREARRLANAGQGSGDSDSEDGSGRRGTKRTRAAAAGGYGDQPVVTTRDGRAVFLTTPDDKSAFCAKYGWLVDDVVGTAGKDEPQTEVRARARPRLSSVRRRGVCPHAARLTHLRFGCSRSSQAMDRCHWRWLMANALSLLHVALLGGILGGWAPQTQSTAQLAAALAVKAAFTQ